MGDKFKLIAITPENSFDNEIKYITTILDFGFSYVHIRKPHMNVCEMGEFINRIPSAYHNRLKLNDHPQLIDKFHLGGIHVNQRTKDYPVNEKFKITKSTHSLEELKDISGFEYVFLSPIFDSISKRGYCSHFDKGTLVDAGQKGLINHKVVALGGVDSSKIEELRNLGFGGAAFLGYLFNASTENELKERIKLIINKIN